MTIKLLAFAGAVLLSASASAATCSPFIDNVNTTDVKLGGVSATSCGYAAGVNPQQGAGTTGLNYVTNLFGTGWTGDGFNQSGASAYNNASVTTTFALTSAASGTWSAASATAANYDIVVFLHTGQGATYYYFDDVNLSSTATAGSWLQMVLNNGNPRDYSNFNVYYSAGEGGNTGGQVPLPGSLALLGLGVCALGMVRRKK